MPKKRSESQKIGEIGENFFKEFALKNELLPNKIEYDYGIDFVCQTTKKGTGGIGVVGGTFICVNVKSSQANRVRGKLDNNDLEAAFICESPIMFILADIKERVIYYKFLDLDLLEEFQKILISGGKFTLTPTILKKGMFEDEIFQQELTKNISVEYQNRIKLKRLQLKLGGFIENCELRIINNQDGNIAIVKAPRIEDFYNSDNKDYPLVRNLFLAQDFQNTSWLPPSTIDKRILDNIGPLASKILMIAPVKEGDEQDLFIKSREKFTACCKFRIRKLHDETSFYHPAGISLVFSEARKHDDNLHYHHFDVLFDENKTSPLFKHPDIVNFLSACKRENQLYFRRKSTHGIDLEHWPELIRLNEVLTSLKMIYKKLKIKPTSLGLNDIQDIKFATNFSLLQTLLESTKIQKETLQGFVLTPEETPLTWKDAILTCPILFSLPEENILFLGRFEGKMAYENEEKVNPVGMRFFSMIDFDVDENIHTDSPTFPILSINGTMAVEYKDTGISTQKTSPIDFGIRYSIK